MSSKATMIIAGFIAALIALLSSFLLLSTRGYKVTFDTDGGSEIPIQTVKKGGKVIKPDDPTKEEYDFVRWEYNDEEYDFSSTVKENMTLKAIWTKSDEEAEKYKLTFNVEGKTKTIEVSESSEINVSELGFEDRSGYALVWYVDGKEYDLTTPITKDLTIEGKYEKVSSYTVKFNSNGGTRVNNQTVNVGGKVSEPNNMKKEGYIFDGWYLNNKKYDFNTVVTGNITLVAKWKEDPNVKRYEVKFNSDGGNSVATQRVIAGKTAVQPKNPTRSGYTFEGWYLDGSKYNFSLKVNSNITLVARWKEVVINSYSVIFNSNGGSSVPSQTVTEGNKVTKPNNPTKEGYNFGSWQLNGSNYDFNQAVTGNIVLNATWVEKSYTFKVTLVDNYSPDRIISIYEDGTKINFTSIEVNGNKICTGSNPTINKFDVEGINAVTVVLINGRRVTANRE